MSNNNFSISIQAIKESLPETCQLGIDDDFYLFNVELDNNFKSSIESCKLEGNIILYCIKGSIRLSINLKEYDIRDGSFIIITPQDIIKLEKNDNVNYDDLHFVMIAMSNDFISNLKLDFRKILDESFNIIETPIINLNYELKEILEDHLKLIGKITGRKLEMYKDAVRSIISSMVTIISGQWLLSINKSKTVIAKNNIKSEHKKIIFNQFIKYVSENYASQRTVIFYADKLCISPKYLSKLIREISGKSASEWINMYVMLEAKNLLKYTNFQIKEIVYRLNFPNQTVFYKYFKAHSGITPTEFRKQH